MLSDYREWRAYEGEGYGPYPAPPWWAFPLSEAGRWWLRHVHAPGGIPIPLRPRWVVHTRRNEAHESSSSFWRRKDALHLIHWEADRPLFGEEPGLQLELECQGLLDAWISWLGNVVHPHMPPLALWLWSHTQFSKRMNRRYGK